jgi:hypothetical protein
MIPKMKGKQLFFFIIVIKKRFSGENKSEIFKEKLMYFTSKTKKKIALGKSNLVYIFKELIVHPGLENRSFFPAYNNFHIRLFPEFKL